MNAGLVVKIGAGRDYENAAATFMVPQYQPHHVSQDTAVGYRHVNVVIFVWYDKIKTEHILNDTTLASPIHRAMRRFSAFIIATRPFCSLLRA